MPEPITISIAMCTYNGERYLEEQLESFLKQKRLPDEVVICDDGSKDGTLRILEEFAAKAPLLVRIYRNIENMGWSKNFEKAMNLCTGDLIALSDQDDEWLSHKLEKIESIFKQRPSIGYLLHNSLIVNNDLKSLGTSLWDLFGYPEGLKFFKKGEFIYWLLKNKPVFGHTMTFHSHLKDALFPIPENCHIDVWIAMVGNLLMDMVLIPEPLAKYRQHAAQSVGLNKNSLSIKIQECINLKRDHILEIKRWWDEALSRSISLECNGNLEEVRKAIIKKINHFGIRGNLPKSFIRKILPIMKETINGNYMRYSNSLLAILKDLVY